MDYLAINRFGRPYLTREVPVTVPKGKRLKLAWTILRGRPVPIALPMGPAFRDLMDDSRLAPRGEMRRWRERFARSLPKREPVHIAELR